MTPLQLEILLWYRTRAEDFHDLSNETVREMIDGFRRDEVLRLRAPAPGNDYRTYELTDRGNAFVDHVCALGLPEAIWIVRTPPPSWPVKTPALDQQADSEGSRAKHPTRTVRERA